MNLKEILTLSQQNRELAAQFQATAQEIRIRLEQSKERERQLDDALQAGRKGNSNE